MKRSIRSLILITLSLILVICTSGCGSKKSSASTDTDRYGGVTFSSDFSGNGTVCENDNWSLIWDSARKKVSFYEKATGTIWGATPAEAQQTTVDNDGMMVKNHPQVDSDIMVYFHNPKTLAEETVLSETAAVSDGDVYVQQIDNGLRVIYDFYEQQIVVPVEYTIENDRFAITVHPEQIADDGVNYVTAVAIAPFMCGIANNREDAWMFMPDGCGAVIGAKEVGVVGNIGSSDVYGGDLAVQKYNMFSTQQQVNFPVYGVKKGNTALLAVIDSGAESASLAWNIGSTNIKYSSVYSVFHIRGYRYIEAPKGFISPLTEFKVFSENIITTPLRVVGYPLSGDSADVTGMADAYRDYLIKTKGLQKDDSSEPQAQLKLVGAVEQPGFVLGIPKTKLFTLTTTYDASDMVSEFKTLTDSDFYVNLVGFGTSGADIGKFGGGLTVAKSLGGISGLKKLLKSADDKKIGLYMDFNLISFNKSSSGFSKTNDISIWPNGQAAWFTNFDTVTRRPINNRFYLLSRKKIMSAVKTLSEKASGMGITGISAGPLSNTIYSDYSDEKTGMCSGIQKDITNALESMKKDGLSILASGANDYAAVSAARLSDVPLYSSAFDFAVADVPFYQMVFRGYRAMSSVSLNLCADDNDALLRCVASGVSPSYTLTKRYENELITSQHSFIYGSSFDGIKQSAADSINRIDGYLKSINGASVESYSKDGDVSVTRFSNGVYAVVNYSDKQVVTQFGTVEPNDYITGKEIA